MTRFLFFTMVFIIIQNASSQDLINKVADEVCDCLQPLVTSGQSVDLELSIHDCIETQIIKYEKMIREDYGDDFYNGTNNLIARDFGVKVGTVLVKECPGFMDLIVKNQEKKGSRAEEFYSIAEKLASEGNYMEAIKKYDQAIQIDPKVFNYYNSRGVSNYLLGNYYKAISDFFMAKDLEPYNHMPYYNTAYSMYQLNDMESALKEVNKSIKLNDHYCASLNLKGLIFDNQNEIDSLKYYFKRAYNCDSTVLTYRYNVGYSFYRDRDYANALLWFLNTYANDTTDLSLVSYIGICYNNIDDYTNAIMFHTKIIESSDSQEYVSYYNRGLAYFNLKDFENAIKDFSMANSIDSTDNDIADYLARAYYESDNLEEAEKCMNKLIRVQSGNADYYDFRAKIYTNLDKYELAIQDYTVSINLYPNDCNIHFLMGELYAKLGRDEEAANSFKISKDMGCTNR